MDLTPWEPNQLQIAPVTHTHIHKHLSVHRQTQITPWIYHFDTHTHVSLECESYSVLRRLKLALKSWWSSQPRTHCWTNRWEKIEQKRTFSCPNFPMMLWGWHTHWEPCWETANQWEDPPPGAVEAHHISRPVCVCADIEYWTYKTIMCLWSPVIKYTIL